MDATTGVLFVSLGTWAALAAWCNWRQASLEQQLRDCEHDAGDREAAFEAAMTEVIRELQNDNLRTLKHLNRRLESLEIRTRALGRAHQPMPRYTAVPDPIDGEVH